ncbi:MAG: ankyrin repeat protein [Rickettsiaceae bacterium]|jgi:hypothetical protein|nr:ankyrin repeat protein [Rickettsiaceae bacterium]
MNRTIERIKEILIGTLGEEAYWREMLRTTYAGRLIDTLAARVRSNRDMDLIHLSPLPQIAIREVIKKIMSMEIHDTNGVIGGEYFAFLNTLKEEMQLSTLEESRNLYNEYYAYLDSVLNSTDIEHIENTKEKVTDIYRIFMSKTSSYSDIQYEGKAIAEWLDIHLIVRSYNDNGEYYEQEIGSNPSKEVFTIVLRHTQDNRSSHYVLERVNDVDIPPSIAGAGNCLFDSLAQAMLELYIQYFGLDTEDTYVQRRVLQLVEGINLGLVSRSSLIENLKNEDDLFREYTAKALQYLASDLDGKEIETLRELSEYDVYQTVRIAAAETLYLKGNENDKIKAIKVITNLFSYPGPVEEYKEGADLVRTKAIESFLMLIQHNNALALNENQLNLLRNLMNFDAYQTVRIEAAKALYLNTKYIEDSFAARILFAQLLLNYTHESNEVTELIRVKAAEAIGFLQEYDEEMINILRLALDSSSDKVKVAATYSLDRLGQIKEKSWHEFTDRQTGSKYASNGEVKLAVKFHLYELLVHMADHENILKYQNDLKVNFIPFTQKYLASGSKEFPNKKSVAFIQALRYSITRYYNIPADEDYEFNDEAEFVSQLFSLPDKTTATLSLYNLLLKDFITRNPQGLWATHKKNDSHFNNINNCHIKVAKAIANNEISKHKTAIDITMATIVHYLYRALHAFKDYELIKDTDFNEDELRYMEKVKFAPEEERAFRNAYLGQDKERDILHVKGAIYEEQRTLHNISTIGSIQSSVTLLPYLKKQGYEGKKACESFLKFIGNLTETNKRYTTPEDAISFLLKLRDTMFFERNDIQLLGIGFHGSFFEAGRDSFDDETAVYISFTEQFRITGSIFLNYVAFDLRKFLSEEFETRVMVRVESHTDLTRKLMCHYTMEQIWEHIIDSFDQIDETLTTKMLSLINKHIETYIINPSKGKEKLKIEQDHLAAYLELDRISMINQLQQLNIRLKNDLPFVNMTNHEKAIYKKFGIYILNTKMYSCVETQILPSINCGWFFPIILNPVSKDHKLISFQLGDIEPSGIKQVLLDGYAEELDFAVAKPCDRYCQPASTAYDIITEIVSQFSEIRGFVGTSMALWERYKSVVPFSDDESIIYKDILHARKSTIDHRYNIYNKAYQAQSQECIEGFNNFNKEFKELYPSKNTQTNTSVSSKKTANINDYDKKGNTVLTAAVHNNSIEGVKQALLQGADVNIPTKQKLWYPIFFAVMKGNKEIFEILLNHGAAINVKDKEENTLLHVAANFGHKEMVEILLLKGLDHRSCNNKGKTSLDLAKVYDPARAQQKEEVVHYLNDVLVKETKVNELDDVNTSYSDKESNTLILDIENNQEQEEAAQVDILGVVQTGS